MIKIPKDNKYIYKVREGTVSGCFNIYQTRNGFIMLLMGNSCTQLTEKQVKELSIDVYDLIDFDHDDYLKAYGIVQLK